MVLGFLRLVLLVLGAALVCSSTETHECGAAVITPPPLVRRDDPIGSRTDFVGYQFGFDNTWTPQYCYGWVTTVSNFINCCYQSDYCDFPIGCDGASIVETIFETASRSRTQTVPCGGIGPQDCLTALVLQTSGDSNALTSYYCGLDPIINPQFTAPTLIRTLTSNAPVWTVTPSNPYTPPSQTSSSTVQSTKTSSTSSTTTTGESSSSSSSSSSSETGTTSSSSSSSTQESSPGKTQAQTTTSSSSAAVQSDTSSGDSPGLSHTDQIAIGIGVGLGVPLIVLAALAWLCPHPLQRLRSRVEAVVSSGDKPELPAENTIPPPAFQWYPEMMNTQAPTELHGQPRAELSN